MQANFIQFLMNPHKWWIPITLILVISITGVGLIGYETYYKAPPIPDFVNVHSESVFSQKDILDGQAVFQKYALMEYGSMFGDGANRGPDYTAEALHQVTGSQEKKQKRKSSVLLHDVVHESRARPR